MCIRNCIFISNIIIANIYYEKKADIDVKLFFKETFKGIWKSLLISYIICKPLTIIEVNNLLVLGIQCAVYSIIYIMSLIKWGLNYEEKQMIKGVIFKEERVYGNVF